MAVIDPRTYRSSTSTGVGRVTTHNEAMSGVPQPPKVDYKAMFAADAANLASGSTTASSVPKAPELHGWKGFVADVMGNDIVKTVLKPLQVLDYGRRTVLSGVKELIVDPLSGQDSSWDDFTHQVGDASFGAGKILASVGGTGNKWVDRVIGGIGDVAADPLTYLSLGTSTMLKGAEGLDAAGDAVRAVAQVGQHAGGQSGRLALAEHFVNVFGKSEEVAARAATIAREGRAGLTAVEVERLGLQKSGYYMFGKRLPAVRIPGSGAAAEMTQEGLARLRLGMSETGMGKAMQLVFTKNDFRDIRLLIARGDIPEGSARAYLAIVNSRSVQRQAIARAGTDAGVEIRNVLDAAGKDVVESFRDNTHVVLEGGQAL